MVPARSRAHTIRVSVMLIAVSHFCNWQMTRRLTQPNGRAMTTTTQHITYVSFVPRPVRYILFVDFSALSVDVPMR